MASKKERLDLIISLMRSRRFHQQEDLLDALAQHGVQVSQSTLSRDLQELKVSKEVIHNTSFYTIPHSIRRDPKSFRHERISQSFGFLSAAFSGNIILIKTLNGYANGLAAEIDENELPYVLGTLAGDDTVLVILSEDANREEVCKDLKAVIPHFERGMS